MNENFLSQLNSLIEMANTILETVQRKEIPPNRNRFITYASQNPSLTQYRSIINSELTTQWETSSTAFIEQNFGVECSYLNSFKRYSPFSTVGRVSSGRGVLKSIRTDCENGLFAKDNTEQIINISDEISNINTEAVKNKCDKEAERNTRIYLITISIFVVLLALSLYNLGFLIASIFTGGILIVGYILSIIFLKEWTLSKLHERVLELEKNRIYKRFDID